MKSLVSLLCLTVALALAPRNVHTMNQHQYYPFSLGKHVVHGNQVEFTFPSPPPASTLYLFTYRWKSDKSYKKARLVVNLYDKSKALIGAGESVWKNMQDDVARFGSASFGSVVIKGISRDNIQNVAYFSMYLQKPPGKEILSLSDKSPEVRFARQVLAAIKEGNKAYVNLFAGQPLSQEQQAKAEKEYDMMIQFLSTNLNLLSVLPMDPSHAVSVRYPCTYPYEMEFGPQEKHNESVQDGKSTTTLTLSLPIGKVDGNWKILFPE